MKELYCTLIFSIMITTTYANSPVTEELMDKLNTINLPNGIRNQINAAQAGISGRTKLESEIAYNASQRAFNIDELVRTFSNDTSLDYGVDSLLTTFKIYNVPQLNLEITKAYLTKGDITNARLMNDSIKAEGTDTSFTKMMDVAIELKEIPLLNMGIMPLVVEASLISDFELKQKVVELAASPDSKEYPGANAILKYIFNYFYDEYIEPVSWNAPNHSMLMFESNEEEYLPGTQLFPNPSNGLINFTYSCQENDLAELAIFDIAGKLIKSYQLSTIENAININNTELNAGTYMYKYIINGTVSKTDKLIIIK